MKALLLTNEYPPNVYGGAGVHVEYLSKELSKLMGVEVRSFGDQDVSEGPLRVRGFDVPASLLSDDTPKDLRSTIGSIGRCLGFSAQPSDADIVHCHTWYTHMAGIYFKLLYGIPLVITTHSLEPLRPWKREQLGHGYVFSSWVEKTAIEMADAVIAVSQGTRQDVLNHFDVDESKLHVIANGIDLDEYQPATANDELTRYGVPTDMPYVLFVGRITRQKGIIHLLSAIEHLDPNVGVVLLAGAPDTPEIGEEMQQRVAQLKQSRENVYWIPEMVSKTAAIQFYSHAQVFCCPSIYEPFGIINLEAMACRTPVVASAVGGIPEIVVPEETGLLVPVTQHNEPPYEPVDPDKFARELADGVNRLMRDDALRQRMAEAGRKRVEDRFAWSAVAEQVRDLFNKLTSANS